MQQFSGLFPKTDYMEMIKFYDAIYKADRNKLVFIKTSEEEKNPFKSFLLLQMQPMIHTMKCRCQYDPYISDENDPAKQGIKGRKDFPGSIDLYYRSHAT